MTDDNPCNLVQASGTNGELEGEEQALLFLDSLDGYLMLLDSLSSSLRQVKYMVILLRLCIIEQCKKGISMHGALTNVKYEGWLELASARHSMGSSRLSSALLDLKVQSAATTVMLNELVEESQSVLQPQFTLSKWSCLEERKSSPKEVVDGRLFKDFNNTRLRHWGSKHVHDVTMESTAIDENIRVLSLSKNSSTTSELVDENKRRYKSLSVFGALVSPKLRAAQASFETALETIVEIANMRSSILSSFSQLQKNNKCSD